MLTLDQKHKFKKDGYLVIPDVVPQPLIKTALQAVNHSIGHVGLSGEDLENSRSAYLCAELVESSYIRDLFTETPVIQIAKTLMGEENLLPIMGGKPYPRFPQAPGTSPSLPMGHIDGIGSGTNCVARGEYRRDFTALAVVYLTDVTEDYSGNFTVWPGSHRALARYFQEQGHQVLSRGLPSVDMPENPIMIKANAGDLIFAHYLLYHDACVNISPNVRHAAIARLRHKDIDLIGNDAYTQIWREWTGVPQT